MYRRPLGVGLVRVAPVLPRLADGTPQKPQAIVLMRPKAGKNEDARFANIHETILRVLSTVPDAVENGLDSQRGVHASTSDAAIAAALVRTPKFNGINVLLRVSGPSGPSSVHAAIMTSRVLVPRQFSCP